MVVTQRRGVEKADGGSICGNQTAKGAEGWMNQ
jgi:hypothetical protein